MSTITEEREPELVNGKEEYKNLGEYEHSIMQFVLAELLRRGDKQRGTRTLIEQTVQIDADNRRIPDVAIFSRATPIEAVFSKPPITVIEILSREDRVQRYEERIEDYRRFGVQRIYVIDPHTQKAWDVSDGSWIRTDRLRITDMDSELLLADLITALKEQEA
jgi:Uma2 family endonuclease